MTPFGIVIVLAAATENGPINIDTTKDEPQAATKTYENKLSGELAGELEVAEELGVRAIRAGTPEFDELLSSGEPIKWAVLTDGTLVIVPKYVSGEEIKHTVLSGGGAVIAAGEVDVAGDRQHGYIGLEINNRSGHYEPEAPSLRIGVEAFKNAGVPFAPGSIVTIGAPPLAPLWGGGYVP